MFFPLGALGAFGGQFFPGMESGMDVSGKLAALGGQDAFMKALQQAQLGGAENLTPQGGFTPDPGVSSERSQMPTPQAPMAPMQPGMAPPQGGFAGSIPGAQAPPQQPGGAQPPGVPPMQRMASADPSGGMSPIDSPHVLAVKGFEGYSPRATWDYKQYSGGYGTRATPGQQFTPQSADSALQDEWYKAKTAVDRFAPGLPQGPRDALTSLTFNAGTNWMNDRLGKAVRAGDMQTAAQLLQQYNHAGGRPLPGLTQRRQEEGRWMLGQPPSPQALAAGRAAEARAAGQRPVPESVNQDTLKQGQRNLMTGNLLSLPQMAQLVERAHPNASPMEKFYAMKAGMKLLGGSSQMQLMSILQRQQQLDLSERREKREEEAQQFRMTGGEAAANTARMIANYQMAPVRDSKIMGQVYQLNPQFNAHQFANDQKMQQYSALAEPKAIQSAMQQEEKKFASIHGQALFLDKNYQNLLKLAERVNFTGIPSIDGMIKSVSTALGGTAALDLQTQLKSVMDEAAKVLSGATGAVLPEGSRRDLENLRSGNVTFAQLKDIYERVIK